MAVDLCQCGSGLTFERCHGDPSNDYARQTALQEARAIAALFPAVRVRGGAVGLDYGLNHVVPGTQDFDRLVPA